MSQGTVSESAGPLFDMLPSLSLILNDFSQVNFVGKLLGPQGSTIKRLQEDTGAKISVLGKGSMRDKTKVCPSRVLLYIV